MNKLITDYLDVISEEYYQKKAFVTPDGYLTYFELIEKAKAFASYIAQIGIYHKAIVILMPESLKSIVSFIGVAYSGNFYTPISPDTPKSRISLILSILQPSLVVVEKKDYQKVMPIISSQECSEVAFYEDMIECSPYLDKLLDVRRKMVDSDLLYVLFTSGSTGIPKGVAVPHNNAVFTVEVQSEEYSFDENLIIGNQFALYFAASVFIIYGTIYSKGTCCFGFDKYFFNKNKWRELLKNLGVNVLTGMPATFNLLRKAGCIGVSKIANIKKIIFGGDRMLVKDVKTLINVFCEAEIFAVYGATEVGGNMFACSVNQWLIDRNRGDDEYLPMGKKLRNIDVFLMNGDSKSEKQEGVQKGEMYIRFSALPFGYFANEKKTSEVYIDNPYQKNYKEKIFRSKDMVYKDSDGYYYYINRLDFMIKRHGFRIELGEIESASLECDYVNQACCIWDEEKELLLLFYVGDINEGEIYQSIRMTLPSYMIPDRIIRIEEIPLNTNGKYDRQKLKLLGFEVMENS